ncbi:MAG: recombinase family protein [Pirellulaceae bacterium]|nr:recombinase family protein [Pirellulaceae bacterium]
MNTKHDHSERIKACGYIRMSTPDQKESPEIQKEVILALAEREGYEIVAWYEDLGRSGSKNTQKRTEWLRLLADAPKAEWKVVLIFSRSRFSRLDSIEEGFAKQRLREAKKTLHCITEGPVDWETAIGRIMDTIRVEQEHEYSRKLGPLVLRGKVKAFLSGKACGKKCPYGMARRVIDPQGATRLIPRKEKFFVPRGWSFEQIPGDPVEVETVQWIFQSFVTMDVGYRWLACELNKKKIPSPRGRMWNGIIVKRLVKNETYVGDTRYGKNRTGKFAHLEGEEVVESDGDESVRSSEGLLRTNTHEGLIDRTTWEMAQEKVHRLESQSTRRRPRGECGFALSSLLICGHCKKTLFGRVGKGRKKAGYTYYTCSSGQRYAGAAQCAQWTVREKDILPFVINKVVETIDERILRASSVQPPKPRRNAKEKVDVLKRRLTDLDQMIRDGWDRWGSEPSLRRGLEKRLGEWERERDLVAEQIEQASQAAPQVEQELLDFQKWLAAAKEELVELQKSPVEGTKLEGGLLFTPAGFREVLQRYGFRITCWWKKATSRLSYPVRWELDRVRVEVGVNAETAEKQGENGEADAAPNATDVSTNVAYGAVSLTLNFTGLEVLGSPKTVEILTEIHELRKRGASLQEIADHLNEKNWRTSRGCRWSLQGVSKALRRIRKHDHRTQ